MSPNHPATYYLPFCPGSPRPPHPPLKLMERITPLTGAKNWREFFKINHGICKYTHTESYLNATIKGNWGIVKRENIANLPLRKKML